MKTRMPSLVCDPTAHVAETCYREAGDIENPFDVPDSSENIDEPDDANDLEDLDFELDEDTDWDVFIPDDDEYDPEPDLSDFDAGLESGAWDEEPD